MGIGRRGKSSWNLFLLFVGLLASGVIWCALCVSLLYLQASVLPGNVLLAGGVEPGKSVMFVPMLFPSLVLGMMAGFFVTRMIRPARRTLEAENPKDDFRKTQKQFTVVSLVLLVVLAPVSLLGAFNYFAVRDAGIDYRPLFSTQEVHYDWADISGIEIVCRRLHKGSTIRYIVTMSDGREMDLYSKAFVRAYARFAPYLRSQKDITYRRTIDPDYLRSLEKRYDPDDYQHLLAVLGIPDPHADRNSG